VKKKGKEKNKRKERKKRKKKFREKWQHTQKGYRKRAREEMQGNSMEFTEMLYITTSLASIQSKINQDYLVTSRNLPVTLRRVQLYDETCNTDSAAAATVLPQQPLCKYVYGGGGGEGQSIQPTVAGRISVH
jgi:hypothetical protein